MRRPTAEETPPPAGNGAVGPSPIAMAGALALLGRLVDGVERLTRSLEWEADYDVTYVVGGLNAAAAVSQIQLPRTLRHVEMTLTVDSSVPMSTAVFAGQIALVDAQNRHKAATAAGPSGAICSSSGGSVTARDYLDGTGILTVLFTGAATTFANVRVRSLDRTQTEAQRT
jgi:hypothetical protein